MKILIVGFPRSGTSLTNRIIQRSPNIEKMYFEKFILLERGKQRLYNKKSFFSKYKKLINKNFGEKIIWTKRVEGKGFGSVTGLDYCERWNENFGDEAKILNIVRHPIDSWNSLFHLRKKQKRFTNIDEQFEWYKECAVEFITKIPNYKNCFSFKYEDLILNKDELIKKIYHFCGLPPKEIKEEFKAKRVFAHKRTEVILMDKDYSDIIKAFNRIEGVRYE